MEQESSLSFFELNRRLDEMPEFDSSASRSGRKALYGFALTVAAFFASFLVTRLPPGNPLKFSALVAVLTLEVAGLCLTIWYSRRDYFALSEPRLNFARQLDHDFVHHFALLNWLKGQPTELLEQHASMARFRSERFTQKLPLLVGGVPSLGVIPVVIAVYFQIREYAAGRQPGWVDLAAGFLITVLYFTAWGAAMMKSRMEAMDMYLQTALDMKRSAASGGTGGADNGAQAIPQPTHPAH